MDPGLLGVEFEAYGRHHYVQNLGKVGKLAKNKVKTQ